MEYCDGDLHKFLPYVLKSSNGQINKILVGAAQALVQLDELGIVHRDIKPQNMLLKGGKLIIADFGIAVLGRHGIGTWGTPGYMAPEVYKSDKDRIYYNNKESLQNY
jgi:serine/threonine protein kinase